MSVITEAKALELINNCSNKEELEAITLKDFGLHVDNVNKYTSFLKAYAGNLNIKGDDNETINIIPLKIIKIGYDIRVVDSGKILSAFANKLIEYIGKGTDDILLSKLLGLPNEKLSRYKISTVSRVIDEDCEEFTLDDLVSLNIGSYPDIYCYEVIDNCVLSRTTDLDIFPLITHVASINISPIHINGKVYFISDDKNREFADNKDFIQNLRKEYKNPVLGVNTIYQDRLSFTANKIITRILNCLIKPDETNFDRDKYNALLLGNIMYSARHIKEAYPITRFYSDVKNVEPKLKTIELGRNGLVISETKELGFYVDENGMYLTIDMNYINSDDISFKILKNYGFKELKHNNTIKELDWFIKNVLRDDPSSYIDSQKSEILFNIMLTDIESKTQLPLFPCIQRRIVNTYLYGKGIPVKTFPFQDKMNMNSIIGGKSSKFNKNINKTIGLPLYVRNMNMSDKKVEFLTSSYDILLPFAKKIKKVGLRGLVLEAYRELSAMSLSFQHMLVPHDEIKALMRFGDEKQQLAGYKLILRHLIYNYTNYDIDVIKVGNTKRFIKGMKGLIDGTLIESRLPKELKESTNE